MLRSLGISVAAVMASSLMIGLSPDAGVAASSDSDDALLSYNEYAIASATQNGHFAGFSASDSSKVFTVYETPSATAAEEFAIRSISLPDGFSLAFAPVDRSWTQLEQVEEKLPSLLPATLRPLLSGAQIDESSNRVDVKLSSVPVGAQQLIDSVIGVGITEVTQGANDGQLLSGTSDTVTPDATGQHRNNELSGPWHGGARIAVTFDTKGDAEACSAGLVIQISGIDYGTSAGHCGTGGSNSIVYGYNPAGTNFNIIGQVKHRSVQDDAWDNEYYNGDQSRNDGYFSSAVWNGAPDSSTGSQVLEAYTPSSGAAICADGATSGQKCSTSASPSGQCQSFYNTRNGVTEYVCGLGTLASDSVCTHGDSGGPVIRVESGGVGGIGDIVGVGEGMCYYQTTSKILSHWGATLVTG